MSDKAYIGIRPCGCVTFAQVVGTDTAKNEEKEIKRVIASGRRIEVVSTDEARERLTFDCSHANPSASERGDVADLVRAARGQESLL
jgi:hypothetical protein